MLLHQMIDEAALRRPEAPAIRCDGATLSYEELARQANGLARVLIGTGLQRGDRVAVLLGKGPQRSGGLLRGARVRRGPGADRPEVTGRAGGSNLAGHGSDPPGFRARKAQGRPQCARRLSGGGARGRARGRRRHILSMHPVANGLRGSERPATGCVDGRSRSVVHPPHLGLDRDPETHPPHPPQRNELRRLGGGRVLADRTTTDSATTPRITPASPPSTTTPPLAPARRRSS